MGAGAHTSLKTLLDRGRPHVLSVSATASNGRDDISRLRVRRRRKVVDLWHRLPSLHPGALVGVVRGEGLLQSR